MTSPHKASQKQENRVASLFGGRTTPGSGNTWSRKNDVRTADLSFELKTTGKKQYTLKASELEKGEREALLDGRDFAFGIEMNRRNWVVISEEDFVTLRELMSCAQGDHDWGRSFERRGEVESCQRCKISRYEVPDGT